MSELLGMSVEDLVRITKERKTRIPSEIGAFIALETCEALLQGPAKVRPKDVRIAEDGSISVYAAANTATSEEAARSIVIVLSALLLAAGTGVPKALVGLLERGPSSARWDLGSIKDDLEASLVPLNRAAARRVLSRLLREAKRPISVPPMAPAPAQPHEDDLDGQLDALMDAPEAKEPSPLSSGELDAELDSTLSELSLAPQHHGNEESTVRETPSPNVEESQPAPFELARKSQAPTDPPPKKERARVVVDDDLAADLDRPKRGSVMPWLLAFAALIAATAAAIALIRPDLLDRALGRPPEPEVPTGPTAEERAQMERDHLARYGTLTVHATPERAQVLLYVGRGPAVAQDLPTGVAHEFVAIADGRAPTRAVLPADAEWERVEGQPPRYELAMQAGQTPMEVLDLGPTGLPRDVGSPGDLGEVRIVTNPPGARVYVLVGFSPHVVVENVRTDEAMEILVFLEDHPVERVVVGPSDWHATEEGTKTAEVTVALDPEPED